MISMQAVRARKVTLLDVHNVGAGGLAFRLHAIMTRIAERFGKEIGKRWAQALASYVGRINEHQLIAALSAGSARQLENLINLQGLQDQLERAMRDPLLRAVQAGAGGSQAMLRAKGIDVTFNAVHANVVRYAQTRAARLVTSVPRDVRETIRLIVAIGVSGKADIGAQARMIKEVVGLPRNWALAPLRFGDELREKMLTGDTTLGTLTRRLSGSDMVQIRARVEAGTLTPDFINDMESLYAERLISLRAETIARTETLAATNYGAQESWRQAVDDGDLPAASKQFWIVTPDDRLCPICVEIPGMNPDGVGVDEQFETPEGPVDGPPAPHPNCRCSIGLVLPGATGEVSVPSEEDVVAPTEVVPTDEEQ